MYVHKLIAEATTYSPSSRDECLCPQQDLNPAIPAFEQLQTYTLDCRATVIDVRYYTTDKYDIDRITVDLVLLSPSKEYNTGH